MEERFDLEEQEKRRRENEVRALFWLARTIKADNEEIKNVLEQVRNGPCPYKTMVVKKRSGGRRELNIPSERLKKIQRKINKWILCDFPVANNVYGFSGGSIRDAINPHLEAKSILCVDIKNAFPSVGPFMVFNLLMKGREVTYFDYLTAENRYLWYEPYHKAVSDITFGYMSWYAARIVMQLTTYKNQLPQGAPTSPKLFDIFCRPLDEKLLKFANKVGGKYTRYADNIFFSMPDKTFPKPIKNAVSHRMRKTGFVPHKFKVRKIGKEALRILGLNVIGEEIHNTRAFKGRLKFSVYHVGRLLDLGMKGTPKFETARRKLQGQMQFARKDTLPKGLLDAYSELQERLS